MYLRYYLDEKGNRVYTLKMKLENGQYTHNAHPGRILHNSSQIQP
jgi:rRNA maturation protein Nop10